VFCLTTFLILGCNPKAENLKKFTDTLETYHRFMKDAEVDEAAKVVDPELRIAFFKKAEELLRQGDITDFFVRTVVMNEEGDEANVLIVREVYGKTLEVRQVQVEQKWKRIEGDWLLTSEQY